MTHPIQISVEQIPRGVWLGVGSTTRVPYPCLCGVRGIRVPTGSCGDRWCPCWGRLDVRAVPAHCCARRNVAMVLWAAQREAPPTPAEVAALMPALSAIFGAFPAAEVIDE